LRVSIRILLAVLIVAAIASAGLVTGLPEARAQSPGDAAEQKLTDKEIIGSLVEILKDDARRDDLIKHLETLNKSAGSDGMPDTSDDAHLDEKFAAVADQHTERLLGIAQDVANAFAEILELPVWFETQVTDRKRRDFWLEAFTGGLLLPVIVALLARLIAGRLLGGATRRLRDNVPEDLRGRIFTGLARGVLELANVAAVLAAGYAALALLDRSPQSRQMAEFVIQAIAGLTAIGVFARLLLAPHAEGLRPLPLASVTAAYLYLWVKRLAWVATLGVALSHIAVPLGASPAGAHAIEILSAVVFAGMVIVLIMQSRDAVAGWIRGTDASITRRRSADIWHILALIYVLVVFGIFVSGEKDGFFYLVRASGVSAAAIVVAVVISIFLDRVLMRVFALDPELDARFPGLRERSNLYRPVLKRVIDILLSIGVVIAILVGWDIGLLEALPVGWRGAILKSGGTILLVILAGVLVWELASGAIARALTPVTVDGVQRAPGSRAKTLLPLLRRAILIALVIFGGLIILAEIGVQIAPLLAGAGVVGLAIGFGSQALVRDVITGLFILIEDTIAVGDFVTVGGHSGVVEDLSIRTIKLRDVAGVVHTVPFGDVTSVENYAKDFAFAVLDIGVAYGEDTDVVSAVLAEIGEEICQDEVYRERILAPLEIMGVHELGDSAVVIRSKIKTKPMMQFSVRREFYRRIKHRFDALGIEIPFPHQTVYFGEKKEADPALEQYRGTSAGSTERHADGSGTDTGSP
jgi:small-conductance mechanosensitive channel